MENEERTTFSEVWNLYRLIGREQRLELPLKEKQNRSTLYVLLRRRFTLEGDPTYLDEQSKLIEQEKFEESPDREREQNQNRFWERYYDRGYHALYGKDCFMPGFLAIQKPPLEFNIREYTTREDGSESLCPSFEALNEETKKAQKAILLKELAIIAARKANVANCFKDTRQNLMNEKREYMQDFLYYATRYNQLVPQKEQILFSIYPDDGQDRNPWLVDAVGDNKPGNPCLDARIPGFTQLSVHFGSPENLTRSLKAVNQQLEKIERL